MSFQLSKVRTIARKYHEANIGWRSPADSAAPSGPLPSTHPCPGANHGRL